VKNTKKIVFLVNNLDFFVSHRLQIAVAMLDKGYIVTIGYGENSRVDCKILKKKGFNLNQIPMYRGSINLFNEVKTFNLIWKFIKIEKPDIIHLITIKPYLYGGIISTIQKVPAVVTAVSGLGSLFIGKDFKSFFLRLLLLPLYKLAFGHQNQIVIMQNKFDSKLLIDWGVLRSSKIKLIKGSGVKLKNFNELNEPKGLIKICYASRLLKSKGVYDFVSAAHLLKNKKIKCEFILAGDLDTKSPTGLSPNDLKKLKKVSFIKVLGFQKNIPKLYAKSHIICLPSYYREGLPKSLLEAAAASRAVVTTDHPGCRDAIIPNKTGLLVPIKDPKKLASAIQYLINNPGIRLKMGKNGRRLAEKQFKVEKVVKLHMQIYKNLLNKVN
jgi:glycosyltransferase involved in cell wall biosynthesis